MLVLRYHNYLKNRGKIALFCRAFFRLKVPGLFALGGGLK
jgi:hypothetical protein